MVTTEVESWEEFSIEDDADIYADIVGVETSARIANADIDYQYFGFRLFGGPPDPIGQMHDEVLDLARAGRTALRSSRTRSTRRSTPATESHFPAQSR